jgi:hypothetical protein
MLPSLRSARGERRRHEAGTVRDQERESLGVGGGVGGDEKAVGGGGGVAHEHLVEVRALVRLGEIAHPVAVDRAAMTCTAAPSAPSGRTPIIPMSSMGILAR